MLCKFLNDSVGNSCAYGMWRECGSLMEFFGDFSNSCFIKNSLNLKKLLKRKVSRKYARNIFLKIYLYNTLFKLCEINFTFVVIKKKT